MIVPNVPARTVSEFWVLTCLRQGERATIFWAMKPFVTITCPNYWRIQSSIIIIILWYCILIGLGIIMITILLPSTLLCFVCSIDILLIIWYDIMMHWLPRVLPRGIHLAGDVELTRFKCLPRGIHLAGALISLFWREMGRRKDRLHNTTNQQSTNTQQIQPISDTRQWRPPE